jgi:Anti-sigma-D factor RsdA to sigma factor binding region
MPDFGRNSRNDEPSLDAIVRSDQFIDALATGSPVAPQDHADAMLASMLGEWRDEMRWPPATGLITERDAVAALRSGLADKQKHTPVRNRRGLSIVGAAAAGVLALGGFGAVVAGAGPGDALYGLRTMLFGAPKQVRDDQVALAAQTQLNQVQDLIAKGDWQQAQDKLVAVSDQVESLGDQEQKQQLLDQWNQLSAKVVQKDPEATVPPGITYTVPPSATELVPAVVTPSEGPEVPPTSVPDLPPITISTTPSESGATTTPSEASSTSPSTTTTVPTTTQAPATTPSAPTTSSAPPTSTTAAATTTAGTTPTSATATTTAAPVTTTTSEAPAAQSPATTTSAVVQQSAASAPPSAPAVASVPASAPAPAVTVPTAAAPVPTAAATVPSPVVQAPKAPPQIVITTTMAPVP